MDKATANANELVKELRISYNTARQEGYYERAFRNCGWSCCS